MYDEYKLATPPEYEECGYEEWETVEDTDEPATDCAASMRSLREDYRAVLERRLSESSAIEGSF